MKFITFTTPRLSVAMPLILGLATIAAAPTVEAVTVVEVNIIDGFVDVNGGGVDATDDLNNVALWCNDAAPVRVDIINGGIDVTESGVVSTADDLVNCDLNDEITIGGNPTPSTNQVDICDGLVEVNEAPCPAEGNDDATNVKLFVLP